MDIDGNANVFRAHDTEAKRQWDQLDMTHRDLVNQIVKNQVQFMPDELRSKIGTLFNQLDADRSGSLDQNDFQATIPRIQEINAKIWYTLQNLFDRDGDTTMSGVATTACIGKR